MAKHKHAYKVVTVVRHPRLRGYVIVTYRCENYNSMCHKRVIQKKETER